MVQAAHRGNLDRKIICTFPVVYWVRLTNILIHYCSNPEPEQLVQEKSTTHKEREAGQSKFERNQGMLALRTQMWSFVFQRAVR